jgi:hypothetical protein
MHFPVAQPSDPGADLTDPIRVGRLLAKSIRAREFADQMVAIGCECESQQPRLDLVGSDYIGQTVTQGRKGRIPGVPNTTVWHAPGIPSFLPSHHQSTEHTVTHR